MKWFDYVFYRAAVFFYKKDGADADRAIWLVTAMQAFGILNIYLTFTFFAFDDHGKQFHQIVVIAWVVLLFAVYALNRWRYQGRYQEYENRFKEGPSQKIVMGIFICVVMVLLFWYPVFFLHFFGTTFINN